MLLQQCGRDTKHTSPATAELVDSDAGHQQHQGFPLPYREVPLQYEPHQQRYHQYLQMRSSSQSCVHITRFFLD